MAVDADPSALAVVEKELRDRYESAYEVSCTGSPDEALKLLTRLSEEGEDVALVLVAQELSAVTCGELLERVRQLHPHAKRGLLVPMGAWTEQPAAELILDSMALGLIDYYVPRPLGSADEVFHQAVSSFLLEWATDRRIVPHTVHIVGEEWTGRAYELRDVFERCAVPHAFWLARSEKGRELVARAGADAKLPLMVLPDGHALGDPSNAEVAQAAGAPTDLEEHAYDLVIVGSGPAGLFAAVYGASEGLSTLVVDEGGIGGQVRASSRIRNLLGFPKGVSGSRFAEQAFEQAAVFGAGFLLLHGAVDLARSGERLELTIVDGRRVTARAVILATGASYRRLDVPSLEALNGAGVFYGAPGSEAHALTGKDTFVVGGGNSAGQAALHLARYARRVTLLVRAESLDAGMSRYLVREVEATPNVETRTGTTVVGGGGEGQLQTLVLRENRTGDEEAVAADALFVLIGARPRTEWLPPEIAKDDRGFVYTGEEIPDGHDWPLERHPTSLETSMPGVFAAGECPAGLREAGGLGGRRGLGGDPARPRLAE